MIKTFGLLTTLSVAFALAGCSSSGQPPTYPVKGTVTMKGQPVTSATVVFVPPEGASYQAATGITDSSGHFELSTFTGDDGAQAGDYNIKVSKFDSREPTKEEQRNYLSYEEEQKLQFGDDLPTPPARNLLPPKYNNEATSGFTFTVNKGQNTVELNLD
jgi:hypothetical protein